MIARIWKAGDCESKKGRAYESVIEFEIGKAYKRMSLGGRKKSRKRMRECERD